MAAARPTAPSPHLAFADLARRARSSQAAAAAAGLDLTNRAGTSRAVSARARESEAALRSAVAPRTRSQTRAQGVSLSSLLQSRSEAAVSVVRAPSSPLPDIDAADRANPLAATDYVNDIYAYYRRAEPKFRVHPEYMGTQARLLQRAR